MVYKIKYSNLAIMTLNQNALFLNSNWSERSVIKFIKKVDKIVLLIVNNPEIFPKWRGSSIRKVVIVKQITMFYEIKEDTINILLFWNNYQNPNNLIDLLNK